MLTCILCVVSDGMPLFVCLSNEANLCNLIWSDCSVEYFKNRSSHCWRSVVLSGCLLFNKPWIVQKEMNQWHLLVCFNGPAWEVGGGGGSVGMTIIEDTVSSCSGMVRI